MSLQWLILISSILYLALLFGIAYLGERQTRRGRSLVSNPYIYSLSLAVFCTAWTYYGSVGQAAQQGVTFLTTYLGPTLMAPLWWVVLRKIIRICKVQRITTLADFISVRYGNDIRLGILVTVICILGVLPYISIQLKAIAASIDILLDSPSQRGTLIGLTSNPALFITIALAGFAILFGTRRVDVTERHEGMVTAIAFESLFKLVAFIAVGAYVTFGVYDGFGDIFHQASQLPSLRTLFTLDEGQYADWFWLTLVAMLAIFLLPRQFQVAVKENVDEKHLLRATWLFPLYLILINLFVLPIALGGNLLFQDQGIDADTYVLAIPQYYGANAMIIFTFLGGLSAATSMIIVSTIALSTMVNNNLLVPIWLSGKAVHELKRRSINRALLNSRRLTIVGILLLAYLYFKSIGDQFSLVSIGIISFVAVAQLAPPLLGGIFWKEGTRQGAYTGLLVGFGIWLYTLVLPTIVQAQLLSPNLLNQGLFGFSALRPESLFGLTSFSPLSQAIFWSLLLNTGCYLVVSLFTQATASERKQAELFVDIFRYSPQSTASVGGKQVVHLARIQELLTKFLGKSRTEASLKSFYHESQTSYPTEGDYRLVSFAERLLAGVIGSASAHVMVMSVVRKDELMLEDLFQVLNESQQLVYANQELKQKSQELEKIGHQLKRANQELQKIDHLKDEFISTVTHEMRTPITSIRAFCEILQDSPELSDEEKDQFLSTIIRETDRMERLINQVLDLEKFESGKQQLDLSKTDINSIIQDAIKSVSQVLKEKSIALKTDLSPNLPLVQADDDRLMQVVLNLISNAIKFCDSDNGQVRISSYLVDNMVKVNVIDNGKGVPATSQEMIFEGFFQAHNQTTKKPVGSGLGLTISRKIIEHHQGKLWVESEPGQWAKFSFTLPTPPVNKKLSH
ncbi:sensor histidine kinase [Tunicatimonas pelagia]|uniref:sensor histidine kinase n=1 Tax=Tunicatimonas pelagia TaxID=931531 RepID=UPI00266535BC|nr:sensor histidine kinase [Tunicatimonas pelagia]WKN43049.1 sensor histidine kinase [Tunicatimonas pelagia]